MHDGGYSVLSDCSLSEFDVSWPVLRSKMSGKLRNLCKSLAVSFSGLLRSSSTSESFSRSSSEIYGAFGLSSYSVSDSVSTVSGGVLYELSSESSLFPDRMLPIISISESSAKEHGTGLCKGYSEKVRISDSKGNGQGVLSGQG